MGRVARGVRRRLTRALRAAHAIQSDFLRQTQHEAFQVLLSGLRRQIGRHLEAAQDATTAHDVVPSLQSLATQCEVAFMQEGSVCSLFLTKLTWLEVEVGPNGARAATFRILIDSDTGDAVSFAEADAAILAAVQAERWDTLEVMLRFLVNLYKGVFESEAHGEAAQRAYLTLERDVLSLGAARDDAAWKQRIGTGFGLVTRGYDGLTLDVFASPLALASLAAPDGLADGSPRLRLQAERCFAPRALVADSALVPGISPAVLRDDMAGLARTPPVCVRFVVLVEPPLIAARPLGLALQRAGDDAVTHSGATPPRTGRRPGRLSLRRALLSDVCSAVGGVACKQIAVLGEHHEYRLALGREGGSEASSLGAASDVAAAAADDGGGLGAEASGGAGVGGAVLDAVDDEGWGEGGDGDDECVRIARVPLADLNGLRRVVALVRQQLAFSELLRSCFCDHFGAFTGAPPRHAGGAWARVVELQTEAPHRLGLCLQAPVAGYLAIDVCVGLDGLVEAQPGGGGGGGNLEPSLRSLAVLTKLLQACLSVPLALCFFLRTSGQ